MTAVTADFEKGTNGNGVSTASGEASATQWSAVPGTAPSYSNAHPAHGTLAARCNSSSNASMLWTTPFGTQSEIWGRAYLYYATLPNSDAPVISWTGSQAPDIRVTSGGLIKLRDATGTLKATSVTALVTGAFYRIEWHAIFNASTGSLECKIFSSADSTTPVETLTTATGNYSSNVTRGNYGGQNSITQDLHIDQIIDCATAYPGPFPVSTTAPVASGLTTTGSVVSCDGGIWNSGATFTLGYQWQRDVAGNLSYSNIAAATASTYTLAVADLLCNVRCVVTATGVQATNESATANSNSILDSGAGGPGRGVLLPLMGVG